MNLKTDNKYNKIDSIFVVVAKEKESQPKLGKIQIGVHVIKVLLYLFFIFFSCDTIRIRTPPNKSNTFTMSNQVSPYDFTIPFLFA